MAEICVDCLNQMMGTDYKEKRFILSDEPEFCENCNEFKRIVVAEKKAYYRHKLRLIIQLLKVILVLIFFIPLVVFYCLKKINSILKKDLNL